MRIVHTFLGAGLVEDSVAAVAAADDVLRLDRVVHAALSAHVDHLIHDGSEVRERETAVLHALHRVEEKEKVGGRGAGIISGKEYSSCFLSYTILVDCYSVESSFFVIQLRQKVPKNIYIAYKTYTSSVE